MTGTIEFGWRVPDFPVDSSDSPTFLRQITDTLDLVQGRFDSAWVADHVVPWARWQAVDTPTVECWTTLTFLAARYPELDWGPIVLCQSYRNPALLAKMVANLCAFLPGRVIFGIGAGWKEDEYRAYGWDFPAASVRIRQMAETVEIVRRLWTADGVTFAGEHYQVRGAYLNPKPDPLPPVMIGGGGEQLTLRVVARLADWWNLDGEPTDYERKLGILRGYCREIGRDYGSIRKTWMTDVVAVAPTEAEAQRMAEASPYYRGRGERGLIGTPRQVAEQIRGWMDIDVTHMQLRFVDFPREDGVRLFIEDVLPQFR